MSRRLRAWQAMILTLSLGVLAAMIGAGLLAYERQPASTAAMRGFYLAHEMGCFACHGSGGISGESNHGSLWGETPPFRAGGSIMSFVQSDEEIREWILYGAPKRLWVDGKKPDPNHGSRIGSLADKTEWDHGKGVGGLIKMPAFEAVFSPEELDDLVAYVKSVAEMERPIDPLAKKGREVATRLGCFGCHGPNGKGGVSNPGSFKGYIPPWDGDDFAALVEDEEELRQWILKGQITRFERNPLATYFTHGQIIQMPAFESVLKPGELEALSSYIYWLRDENKPQVKDWVEDEVPELPSIVARGDWLFHRAGCTACHGPAGAGGVPNKNASGGYVPALNDLAEKMELFEPEDIAATVAVFERGLSLDDPSLVDVTEGFKQVQEQYLSMREFILKGGVPGKQRGSEGEPAMLMPAWKYRLYADGSPHSKADIDAIIAYLLTLQEFEDDD